MASSAYTAPSNTPLITTCSRARAPASPAAMQPFCLRPARPGRRRQLVRALRVLRGPDDHLVRPLPLDRDSVVPDHHAVGVDLVLARHDRVHLGLGEPVADAL